MQSVIQFCERLLTFKLNSQSNYIPPFYAPDAQCWLAGIVHGLVRATMFVSHLESQDCVWTQPKHWMDSYRDEQFADFDKNCMG